MVYRYSFTTRSEFNPSIELHCFKLRALPCENSFQHCWESKLEVAPSCTLHQNKDGLGNDVQWGNFEKAHDQFLVSSAGIVEQVVPYLIVAEPEPYYKSYTRLTSPSSEMDLIVKRLFLGHKVPAFQLSARLMHWVHGHLRYVPGSTTVSTTAAEVLHQQYGVCQDYAHLMITLCRYLGLYARYANGLIAGQGQTHAWVEVSDGNEWRAFDPTNDQEVSWGYIKFAHGRDANDCPINRGRFFRWTNEQMYINAIVEEIQ